MMMYDDDDDIVADDDDDDELELCSNLFSVLILSNLWCL